MEKLVRRVARASAAVLEGALGRGQPWHRRCLFASAAAVVALGGGAAAGRGAAAGGPLSLPKSPVSAGVLIANGVHTGLVAPGTGSAASPPGGVVGSVLPNVRASAGDFPVNEVPITADPGDPRRLLSGGNDYNCPGIQGFYTSNDAGATWKSHCLDVLPGLFGEGDPVVAYDASGNAYIAGIDASENLTGGGIVFQKSANNGQTWSPPRIAVPPFFTGGLTDKPWLEADHGAASPHRGALYLSVTQFNSTSSEDAITVSHSYDGGASWSTVQVGPTLQLASSVDQFSDLAVAPNGTVYVTWMRCAPTRPTGDCGGSTATMLISRSSDGGVTWTAPSPIVSNVLLAPDTCFAYYGCVPDTSERVSDIPVIDVDPVSGALYVAYYQFTGTSMQVRVVKSTNGGTSWSSPTAVFGQSNTHDEWFPWLSVSRAGSVGVTLLYKLSGTAYVAKAAVSRDGGATYSDVTTSGDTSNTLDDGFGGGFIGDYTGNIWTEGTLHQSWPDTRTGVSADETGGVTTPAQRREGCGAKPDDHHRWEVVFGNEQTRGAARVLAHRVNEGGLRVGIEVDGCNDYEVASNPTFKTTAAASRYADRARHAGFQVQIEKS